MWSDDFHHCHQTREDIFSIFFMKAIYKDRLQSTPIKCAEVGKIEICTFIPSTMARKKKQKWAST